MDLQHDDPLHITDVLISHSFFPGILFHKVKFIGSFLQVFLVIYEPKHGKFENGHFEGKHKVNF